MRAYGGTGADAVYFAWVISVFAGLRPDIHRVTKLIEAVREEN